jgi:hypothetical protein
MGIRQVNDEETPGRPVPKYVRDRGPLFLRHVGATARMQIADAREPMDFIVVQFNPAELERSLEVHVGELQPIGWSHTIRQYASTASAKQELKLWLSALAASQQGLDPHIEDPTLGDLIDSSPTSRLRGLDFISQQVCWLVAHCYASAPGKAPSPLWLRWDYNLDMLATLDRIKTSTKVWDQQGKPRIMEVEMSLTEFRVGFRSSEKYYGAWVMQDPSAAFNQGSGISPMSITGSPYRPKR